MSSSARSDKAQSDKAQPEIGQPEITQPEITQPEITRPDSPGTAIAVIRAGAVIHRACSGFADLEWRQPIVPDTVFPLASITKSFTALVVQGLVKQRLIGLIIAAVTGSSYGEAVAEHVFRPA